MQDHIKDVCKFSMDLTDWKRWEQYWTSKSLAREFLEGYGKVHASLAFDTIRTRSRNEFINEFMRNGEFVTKVQVPDNSGKEDSMQVKRSAWASTFLWSINSLMQEKHASTVADILKMLQCMVGAADLEPGLGKAYYILSKAKERLQLYAASNYEVDHEFDPSSGSVSIVTPPDVKEPSAKKRAPPEECYVRKPEKVQKRRT